MFHSSLFLNLRTTHLREAIPSNGKILLVCPVSNKTSKLVTVHRGSVYRFLPTVRRLRNTRITFEDRESRL